MATKTIAWKSGGGYITLTYTGVGNAPISVTSDANELFEDREQTVQIVTTEGTPQKAISLLVKQKGKTYPVGTVFNFAYTGNVQQITLPKGRYKLQCWGAQGGSVSGSYTAGGSKGGYSEGVLTITEPTTIYIFVGGKGTDSPTSYTSGIANGGWNGGGASVRYSSYDNSDEYGESYPRPGGGATDMCLVSSTMDYQSGRTARSQESLLSRFIVAGGGAGASARYTQEIIYNEVEGWQEAESGNRTTGAAQTGSGNYQYWGAIYTTPGFEYRISIDGDCYLSTVACWINGGYEYYGSSFTAKYGGTYYIDVRSSSPNVNFTYTVEVYTTHKEEETITSSGESNSYQQGGGISGRGTNAGKQNSSGWGGGFGFGGNQDSSSYRYLSGAGGGGWYGGGYSTSDSDTESVNGSGGGSGFVNTAANASYRPSGYTGLLLDSGNTISGDNMHPNISGGTETGHSGNGYAKITVLEDT